MKASTLVLAIGLMFGICFTAAAQNAPTSAEFQRDPEPVSPRKASAQFQKDYDGAKKEDAEISRDRANGYTKVDAKLRQRLIHLKGVIGQLSDELKQQCVDGSGQPIPQGCHYVDSGDMKGYIVANPIPPAPRAAVVPPQNAQPPAATPAAPQSNVPQCPPTGCTPTPAAEPKPEAKPEAK